jgi:hypothetical protein
VIHGERTLAKGIGTFGGQAAAVEERHLSISPKVKKARELRPIS